MSCLMVVLLAAGIGQVDADEEVVYYPTYGTLSQDRQNWTVRIHGKIYEPEPDSAKRAATVSAIRRVLGISKGSPENTLFERRLRTILVDAERGKRVEVSFGPIDHRLDASEKTGHFAQTIRLTGRQTQQATQRFARGGKWIAFKTRLPARDKRVFSGRVQLIEPRGCSIISDIDDTIKITDVTDRREMLRNTFLREFQTVPGMPALYARAAMTGTSVHYVSGSPWSLHHELDAFFRRVGLPDGTFHLRHMEVRVSNIAKVLSAPSEPKMKAIGTLLRDFPQRKFLLIGDTGEKDPEIYGAFARRHPEQIVAIFLRNVTQLKPTDKRLHDALEKVDPAKWRLFDQAKQIEDELIRLTKKHTLSP